MKLKELLQSYTFDELMPVITNMFPGTGKYRKPLSQAYTMLMNTRTVPSDKAIRYKILHDDRNSQSYMGAEDKDFAGTWEVCLGKDIAREKGVDLSQAEIAANAIINLCLISRYPKAFESIHEQLIK